MAMRLFLRLGDGVGDSICFDSTHHPSQRLGLGLMMRQLIGLIKG